MALSRKNEHRRCLNTTWPKTSGTDDHLNEIAFGVQCDDATLYRTMQSNKPSRDIYTGLASAYDHFNRVLFGGELPQAMIVLHRKRGAHGYFWAEQFADRKGKSSLGVSAQRDEKFHRNGVWGFLHNARKWVLGTWRSSATADKTNKLGHGEMNLI